MSSLMGSRSSEQIKISTNDDTNIDLSSIGIGSVVPTVMGSSSDSNILDVDVYARGDDGDGIDTIIREYAIGESPTVEPSTGWSTTIVAPEQGQYLWTRFQFTYTNPAKLPDTTSYTVAYCARDGIDGGWYEPSVDDNGNLSWTAHGEMLMPSILTKNIKGPQGDMGSVKLIRAQTLPTDDEVRKYSDDNNLVVSINPVTFRSGVQTYFSDKKGDYKLRYDGSTTYILYPPYSTEGRTTSVNELRDTFGIQIDTTVYLVSEVVILYGILQDAFYILDSAAPTSSKHYDEYYYAGGYWEKIGEDLNAFYTKTEVDDVLEDPIADSKTISSTKVNVSAAAANTTYYLTGVEGTGYREEKQTGVTYNNGVAAVDGSQITTGLFYTIE